MSEPRNGEDWIPEPIAVAIDAADDTYRMPYAGTLAELPRQFTPADPAGEAKDRLKKERRAIRSLQPIFEASGRFSVLAVFQALDAAGKDGAIREVFKGVNPAGLQVTSFKRPSSLEVAHDFLWRTTLALPRDGKIGIFNRSHYEEVLVVRVHPEFLDGQYAGDPPPLEQLWPSRYRAIREHELHLARSNTVVLKFWLDVSPSRQALRFRERLDTPEKRWKFSSGDVRESRLRPAYDEAVLEMFKQTSRPWAPWFCIPADERWYARWRIARIIRQVLAALPLEHPEGEDLTDDEIAAYRAEFDDLMQGKV